MLSLQKKMSAAISICQEDHLLKFQILGAVPIVHQEFKPASWIAYSPVVNIISRDTQLCSCSLYWYVGTCIQTLLINSVVIRNLGLRAATPNKQNFLLDSSKNTRLCATPTSLPRSREPLFQLKGLHIYVRLITRPLSIKKICCRFE